MDSAEYKAFRTGLTYRDVYQMPWSSSGDSKDWRYKRRHTVLGLWRSIKLSLWAEKERREDEAVAHFAHVQEKARARGRGALRRPRAARHAAAAR